MNGLLKILQRYKELMMLKADRLTLKERLLSIILDMCQLMIYHHYLYTIELT